MIIQPCRSDALVGGGMTAFAMLFTRLLIVRSPSLAGSCRATSSRTPASAPARGCRTRQRFHQCGPRAGAGLPLMGRGDAIVLCHTPVSPGLVLEQGTHCLP